MDEDEVNNVADVVGSLTVVAALVIPVEWSARHASREGAARC